MIFKLKPDGIQELLAVEWRINKEKRSASGKEATYLQGKNDGIRIARAILFGDEGAVDLIATSNFAQEYDEFVTEQLKRDGVTKDE